VKLPQQSTLMLTHFGRRSGKAFTVKIWYAEIDGELWIGSLDKTRNWVRNVLATGRARVDFGSGPIECTFEPVEDAAGAERYRRAVAAKYPILSRVVAFFARGKTHATMRARTLG
jgi:deazaflavin-dependent oxidoreductase (nitroreductase family)